MSKNSDSYKRMGYILAIGGIAGWIMGNIALYVLGLIFQKPTPYNPWHFIVVPSFIVLLDFLLIHFQLLTRVGLKPIYQTIIMLSFHGFWAEYVGLQVEPSYNGFLVLFLFSVGLLVLNATAGFFETFFFCLVGAVTAIFFIRILSIDVGYDEKLFLFFFGFYGSGAAVMNSLTRRNIKKIRRQQQLLAEEKQRSEHAYNQMQKVFYPHQLKQIREGSILETTMPIGMHDACVIALDLIASTRFRHENKKEIIRHFLGRCTGEMQKHYSAESMICDGFRIKETGDGFLCSVGFPFEAPDHKSRSEVALELAHHFIRVLEEICAEFPQDNNLLCSIGIAHGAVEGFFTKLSPVQYDLFGPGIVLATRYEQMRKQLGFLMRPHSHIILVQEDVYQGLSQKTQAHFQKVDLTAKGLTVRDDPTAVRVFIQDVPHSQRIDESSHEIKSAG